MAIRFYADESEDKAAKVHVIGGFIGEAGDWEKLQDKWIARLKPTKIRAYHMADCESGYGEFKGWPAEDRKQLTIDLINIISEHDVRLIGTGVLLEDYEQIPPVNQRGTRLGKDKWHLLFQQTLYNAARQLDSAPIGESIAFFFDWREKHGRAETMFGEIRKNEQLKPWRKRLGSITFGHKEFNVPGSLPLLQVADIAAVETRKAIGNPITHPHLGERRSFAALREAGRIQRIDYLSGPILEIVYSLKKEEIELSGLAKNGEPSRRADV